MIIMGYNGWTNRETWLVNLYFGDEIVDYVFDYGFNPETWSADDVARVYEEYVLVISFVQDDLNNVSAFLRDMVNLEDINWDELAEGVYKELEEQWREWGKWND